MDENKNLIQKYVEELNQRNYKVIDELVADEVLVNGKKITRNEYEKTIKERINEYPNYFVKIVKLETLRDKVTLYWHRSGTSTKTGKKLNEQLTSQYHILNGKITEIS